MARDQTDTGGPVICAGVAFFAVLYLWPLASALWVLRCGEIVDEGGW